MHACMHVKTTQRNFPIIKSSNKSWIQKDTRAHFPLSLRMSSIEGLTTATKNGFKEYSFLIFSVSTREVIKVFIRKTYQLVWLLLMGVCGHPQIICPYTKKDKNTRLGMIKGRSRTTLFFLKKTNGHFFLYCESMHNRQFLFFISIFWRFWGPCYLNITVVRKSPFLRNGNRQLLL